MIQDCWIAFLVGGLLCAIGQVLIDYTKLTPARILTGYVVAGVLLSAVGLYPKLIDWAGGGASVPLTGFGNLLARGVRDAIRWIFRRFYRRTASCCWRIVSCIGVWIADSHLLSSER